MATHIGAMQFGCPRFTIIDHELGDVVCLQRQLAKLAVVLPKAD